MAVRNNFGKLLAEKMQREDRLISKSEAARELGVSHTTIAKWINQDNHPYQHLEDVCRYLACSTDQLIEFDPPVLILSKLGRDKSP